MSSLHGFYGTFRFTIDDKGRIQVPSTFRKLMSNEEPRFVVMTRGPDGCIYAFPMENWEFYMRKLQRMPIPNMEKKELIRAVLGPAVNCAVDNQWRVKLPDELVAFAGLEREVDIVGQMDKWEIWHPPRRAEVMARSTLDYEAKSVDLFIGGMGDMGGDEGGGAVPGAAKV